MKTILYLSLFLFVFAVSAAPSGAQTVQPSLADSFRLGQGGGVLCQVQSRVRDAATTLEAFSLIGISSCRIAGGISGRTCRMRRSSVF